MDSRLMEIAYLTIAIIDTCLVLVALIVLRTNSGRIRTLEKRSAEMEGRIEAIRRRDEAQLRDIVAAGVQGGLVNIHEAMKANEGHMAELRDAIASVANKVGVE
jgi:hypothetical protein